MKATVYRSLLIAGLAIGLTGIISPAANAYYGHGYGHGYHRGEQCRLNGGYMRNGKCWYRPVRNCRVIGAHWRNGHWVPAHRVCR